MLSPEQITQYMAAGWTYDQLVAAGHVAAPAAPSTPPPPMGGAASVDALAAALGGADFGNNSEGRHLPDGTHVVEATALTWKPDLHGGPRVIFEYTARESTNPETEIGGQYSKALDPYDKFGYGLNDIKEICAQFHCARDPNHPIRTAPWNPAWLTELLTAAQPIRGTRWKIQTLVKPTKDGSRTFTKHWGWECGPASGVQASAPVAPAAVPPPPGAPQPPPPPGVPPMPGIPQPPPAAGGGVPAPPAAPTGAPAGWPAGVPFPGAGQ